MTFPKKIFFIASVMILILASLWFTALSVYAQDDNALASDSATPTIISGQQTAGRLLNGDVTQPEETEGKEEVLALFSLRPANELKLINFMAFAVQTSVKAGVPANTVILVLLLPLLATIVVFFRHVVGLPTLGMLVPIALSITLLATGITAGLILLSAILFASTLSRLILKKVHIMQLSKIALSIIMVSFFVFITLTLSALGGILTVKQLSIFPVLLLILLSESIVSLQLERSHKEVIFITLITLILAISGFFLLSSNNLRRIVLLYPELILILIPIDFLMGKYFGLRLTEFYRFNPIIHNASKQRHSGS